MALILSKIRLSGRPTAAVVEVNGRKFNLTNEKNPDNKPRLFFVADFEDSENPFAPTRSRAITQQYDNAGTPVWKIPVDRIFASVGKVVPGELVTKPVTPYIIREGQKPATSYSAVVFPHENADQVFLNAGRIPEGKTVADLPPRFHIAGVPGGLTEDELTAQPEISAAAPAPAHAEGITS